MSNNMDKIRSQLKTGIKNYFEKMEKDKDSFISGKSKIPLAIPPYDWKEVWDSLDSLLSMKTTMDKKVKRFEQLFAKYIGVKYAIMVNSGSSANLLALSILSNPVLGEKGIKKGDEIITPAVTWATTVYPITNVGAIPVFVDVSADDYNIDPEKIEKAISKKTKAIMNVHLLGNPCKMDKIKKIVKDNNLLLIEDACEAHGAEFRGKKVGSFGDLATFSFFASHHITTMEGGMIVTNNKMLYELGKSMRTFGWVRDLENKNDIIKKFPNIDQRFLFLHSGFNLRPTELQGAFGINQMKKINSLVNIRIQNSKYWNKRLKPFSEFLKIQEFKKFSKTSHLFYPIYVIENDFFTKNELVNYLEKKHIETRPTMTGNFVKQPVIKQLKYKTSGNLDNANNIMKNSFVLGNHHGIDKIRRKYVADTIIGFLIKKSS
jgi:CDP-4-dehydro-6-deoxyglucose reductase, E1